MAFFSPRLNAKRLAELCYRVGASLEAGIDVRTIWRQEAEKAPFSSRHLLEGIRDCVEAGEDLANSMKQTGQLFPRLVIEMVDVGEQTGNLDQIFLRLSHYYQQVHRSRRMFLAHIAWPVLQLAVAILIVGLMILVMGMISQGPGADSLDPLGFGLTGPRGLVIYIGFIVGAACCIALAVSAVRRGALWTGRMQRLVMRIPMVGGCLEKLALARIAWALQLTLNTSMDLRRAVPLVLRASGNDYFRSLDSQILGYVGRGLPLHAALRNTGAFPVRFVDALEVGETSGQSAEAMQRLSKQYEEEAESAIGALAMIAGFVVWALVAAMIIFLIFRLAGFYIGTLRDAAGV